ncbi:dihydroxyacetone kinase Dak1 [Fusarium solani]
MSPKHFINDPEQLVCSALRAVTLTNPSVGLDAANKTIYIRPGHGPQIQRVSLISGGGSGHEPSFTSMVGAGLLSAAVAGTVFASPSAEQVRAAIMARVDHNGLGSQGSESGLLAIVMNYTGDVLNFGVAVEAARAAGANVQMVTVGDDVAVGRSRAGKVGRRGIAGTVLVQKISGALAARGYSLEKVAHVAQLVADSTVTIGASLEHVHVPGSGESPDGLGVGEVEIGMGIHNEQGWSRENIELPALVQRMLGYLLARDDPERSFVDFGHPSAGVVLLVNNLGGLSPLELGGVVSEIVLQLDTAYDIRPIRIFSGTYMTSLDASGFSITLLRLEDIGIDSVSAVDLLDDPCEALGWTAAISKATWEADNVGVRDQDAARKPDTRPSGLTLAPELAEATLMAGLRSLISSESEITRFDLVVGDGDCGTTLKRGAQGNSGSGMNPKHRLNHWLT